MIRTVIKAMILIVLFYSSSAGADLLFYDPATNKGILDQVSTEFSNRAAAWRDVVMGAASRLFWILGTISFTWTFAMLALRKADLGEFFAEFVRFILFFGFFYWLLLNGPDFAGSIVKSLQQLGETATGMNGVSPSGIVNIGFDIWKQAIKNLSFWNATDSLVGLVLSIGILIVLAIIAVNMLVVTIAAWVIMYAGIIILGFGGSRWTSDMAINYYRNVFGLAVQLFVMILIVGIGQDLLSGFYAKMSKGPLNFEELGAMLVFCIALFLLVDKLPGMVAGIITGAGGGHSGIGNFGAGAVVGAATAAGAAVSTAASMVGGAVGGAVAGTAGAYSALNAAYEKAQQSMANGVDAAGGGAGSGGGSGGQAGAAGMPKPSGSAVAGELGKGVKGAIGKSISDSGKETFAGKVAEAIKDSGKPKEDQDDAGTLSGPKSSGASQGGGNAAQPGDETRKPSSGEYREISNSATGDDWYRYD